MNQTRTGMTLGKKVVKFIEPQAFQLECMVNLCLGVIHKIRSVRREGGGQPDCEDGVTRGGGGSTPVLRHTF